MAVLEAEKSTGGRAWVCSVCHRFCGYTQYMVGSERKAFCASCDSVTKQVVTK